jgi:hypothetical protein
LLLSTSQQKSYFIFKVQSQGESYYQQTNLAIFWQKKVQRKFASQKKLLFQPNRTDFVKNIQACSYDPKTEPEFWSTLTLNEDEARYGKSVRSLLVNEQQHRLRAMICNERNSITLLLYYLLLY